MLRRINYLIRIIITFFRFCIYKLINGRRFNCDWIQLVALNTEFKINRGGGMTITGKNMIEKSTLLQADGGQIKLNQNYINRNCTIVAHQCIEIGYGTTIGPNVCIYDHDHDKSNGAVHQFPSTHRHQCMDWSQCSDIKGCYGW